MAQQVSEATRRTVQEASNGTKRAAQDAAEATKRTAQEASEATRRITEDAAEQVDRGNRAMLTAADIYSETAQLTAEDLQAIAVCSTIAAGGMTEIGRAWMDWFNRSLRTGARASQELLRCTSIDQLADAQRSFLKESFDNFLEGSAQILRISSRVSEDACRPIENRVGQGQGEEERAS